MNLSGLHLLLTLQCNYECDHCFVWGGPGQTSTMRLSTIRELLRQASDLGTVEWIYFEGGEPFLYYPILVRGVAEAARAGFRVGMVSNAYWATHVLDAREWLAPFAGKVQDLALSSDLYHGEDRLSQQVEAAREAAQQLSIPVGLISVAQPASGQLPEGESRLMFRGRAAVKLAGRVAGQSWERLVECPYEDLREPGRVHVDPLGDVHICQGISLGNIFQASLKEICQAYDPDSHPVTGPLLAGGPRELDRRYGVGHKERYADACHMCYETRLALRSRFPGVLVPDAMYGVAVDSA